MNVIFIYNPESGSGKIQSLLPQIEEVFSKRNITYTLSPTTKPREAEKFASESSNYDMIIVAGGDGTLNETVSGLMKIKERPLLGYIPTGTINDMGNLLGIPKKPLKALELILDRAKVVSMDVVRMNNRYFVYAAAAGKFTAASYDVERKSKKRFGYLAYYKRGSQEIFKDFKIPIKVSHDEGSFEGTYSLMLIMNGPRVAGFRLFGTKARMDDGLLEARFFKREPGMLFRLAGFFLSGGKYSTKKNKLIRSSKFLIEVPKDVIWNTDGERSITGPVEINVIKDGIKIVVHPKKTKRLINKTYN